MKKKHARHAKATATSRIGITSVMLVYFCSGACSLIDEVVWVRLLKLTLGNTVYASSIVVSMFMAGLALGALLMSRYADRVRRQLRLYATLEILVTISALLMPWALRLAGGGYRWFFVKYQPQPATLLFVQVLVSALLLLVPTMLMGSTLPLLGRYVTRLHERVGHLVGRLYALNTLGAALGCFLAGFVFIRMVGVMGTLYIAAGINLFVAFGGWILSRYYDPAPTGAKKRPAKECTAAEPEAVRTDSSSANRRYVLMLGFFLSGLISIGYELVWMRSIVVPLGGFTYVFSGVLTIYLIGNVLGAWIGSRLSKCLRNPAAAFGLSLTCLGVLGVFYIPWFATWFGSLHNSPAINKLFAALLGRAAIRKASLPLLHSTFLFLIPAITMGIGFPLALQAWGRLKHKVGLTTGTVYGVNTIGAVLGGIITGFLLIPLMGVQLSITILGLTGIWLGGTMVQLFYTGYRKALRIGALAAVVLLTVVTLLTPMDLFKRNLADTYEGRMLSVREGVTTTVAVLRRQDGTLSMAIDHIQMAGDDIHRSAQKTLGHLGALLHRNPKDVLSFGFGTGETSYCLAQHDLRIDCVEIAPEVTNMALEFFGHINLGEQLSQKVNMIHMDGKNFLNLTDKRYDIIINDSNVHSTSGSAPLFTREHFQSALNHLKYRGLFMTKLHLQGHPKSNFDCILATFLEVFPHMTVWYPVTRPFIFVYLIGSSDRQVFLPKQIDSELKKEKVRNSVAYLNFTDSLDVLNCYLGDELDLRRYLKEYRLNSDYEPYLEFNLDTANLVPQRDFPQLIGTLRRGSLTNHIDWAGLSSAEQDKWRSDHQLRYQLVSLALKGNAERAFLSKLMCSFQGLKLKPDYAPLLEMREECVLDITKALYKGMVNPDMVIRDMDAQISKYPDIGAAWLVKSVALRHKNNVTGALTAGQKALEFASNSPEVHDNLGLIYSELGQPDKAAVHFTKAVQLKPDDARLHYNLAETFIQLRRLQEAVSEYRESLRINPELLDVRQKLEEAINAAKQ